VKYRYTGDEPVILIEYHVEVKKDDVVDLPSAIDNVFFVPVEDKPKQTKEAVN
jgi:hypothetical protein